MRWVSRTSAITKRYEFKKVYVPLCSGCQAKEIARMRRTAKVALGIWLATTVAGIVIGLPESWVAGALIGASVGWIFSIIANAVLSDQTKLRQFAPIRGMLNDGWSISWP
jgi:hypothetical protein